MKADSTKASLGDSTTSYCALNLLEIQDIWSDEENENNSWQRYLAEYSNDTREQ